MQLVKIRINNRVDKILNFGEHEPLRNNHYIIREGDNEPRELFRISKNAKLINGNNEEDLIVKKTEAEDNVLNVVFDRPEPTHFEENQNGFWGRRNRQAQNRVDNRASTPEGMITIGEYYVYRMPRPEGTDHYELKFHLEEATVSIFLYFAKNSETFDAIIDFGSEASQASWYVNGGTQNNAARPINLTESIRLEQKEQAENAEDYVEYESERLYKSIYYIKKDLGDTIPDAWPKYDNESIKFLVAKDIELADLHKDYFQLPNSKLIRFDLSNYAKLTVKLNHQDTVLYDLGEDVIERVLMNNIVLQVLHTIDGQASNQGKHSAYIVLNVLMPNVYPIHITSQKLNQLAEDIVNLLGKGGTRIKAVELRAISESDASLLGYFNNTMKKIPHGNYLIMDAGKGTLDFSIMEYVNHGCPYVNKSRAGIIGAGNAITYGLIVGLMNDFLCTCLKDYKGKKIEEKHSLIRKLIYKWFVEKKENSSDSKDSVDVATVEKLLSSIEKYKKVYNDLYRTQAQNITLSDEAANNVDILDIEKFNQWIGHLAANKINLSEDSQKYVTIEIENIVNAAMRKLIDMTIIGQNDNNIPIPLTGFVFTGRGFLMKQLQEKMREQLVEKGIVSKDTEPIIPSEEPLNGQEETDDVSMKNICMNIHQMLLTGRYDASPSQQTIGVFHRGINVEATTDQTEGKSKVKADPEYDPDSYSEPVFSEDEEENGIHSITSGELESDGISIPGITNDSSIIIGGWRYGIRTDFQNTTGTLYFDGIQYWLTAPGRESQPIAASQNDPSSSSFVFESLFPNIKLKNEGQVKIPKQNKVLKPHTVLETNIVQDTSPNTNTEIVPSQPEPRADSTNRERFKKRMKEFIHGIFPEKPQKEEEQGSN